MRKEDFTIYYALKNRYLLIYGRQQGDDRYLVAVNPSVNRFKRRSSWTFRRLRVFC